MKYPQIIMHARGRARARKGREPKLASISNICFPFKQRTKSNPTLSFRLVITERDGAHHVPPRGSFFQPLGTRAWLIAGISPGCSGWGKGPAGRCSRRSPGLSERPLALTRQQPGFPTQARGPGGGSLPPAKKERSQ